MTDELATSIYKVKSGSFEGPLDLLLSLIESRKLFVNEISLAQVTDDYISYIKSLSDLPDEKRIADVSYFILIAATLILIKSRSLLPNLALTEDEEDKIVNLENRLKLYQIIKNVTIDIKNDFGAKIIFSPLERTWSEPLFSPDEAITVSRMSQSVLEVIAHVPVKEEKLPEVEVRKVINIEAVIDSLMGRVQNALNISFCEFSKSHNAKDKEESRVHVIVSFLAMLELVREGIIDVMQNNTFEDIQISRQVEVLEPLHE